MTLNRSARLSLTGSLKMANYTSAPEDDYDVLIEDDLNSNEIERCDPYDPKILAAQVVPQLSTTVFLAGLLGSLLVVLILVKHKGLKHTEDIYLLNLAVSNLCFLLALPFWAYTATHGGVLDNPFCKILVVLYSIGLYSEAFFNILLTMHRYLVFFPVSLPATTRTTRWGMISSVLAWVLATLVILPESVFYKAQMESQTYKCFLRLPHFLLVEETSWKRFLTLKMNILGLLFPLCVFVFCYARMRKIRRSGERRSGLSKLVFAIMAVFLLMWGPYNIALFLSTFKESFSLHDCKSSYNLDRSIQILRIVAATHCCVNPLLHAFLDPTFRRHLGRLCCVHDGRPLQSREESTRDASREERDHSTEV
ncbi:C-C chemokine receptor-like 2 isoform X1 [Halichoerus grypus]|nr:C-C chemokine receptor-like 2 isoform X2 [Halichoerus grypus]XP_035963544.1 C-C chemokine receptor-like 2 isoform X2 [Halichoerus grypus]XP_035963545.1 C-C chemokine receptor-like 2 isoform X2 [Halichoerus grypus]XP_035963549.1 C-C chemokine receptor-like 2 isoform X2 [Halichoerus grypus]